MDKLKPILAGMLKYHFWVLLGIVVVIALFTWNSAVGHLDDEFSKNKSQIDQQFSKVDNLNTEMVELDNGEIRFANSQWQEDTLDKAKKLRTEVKSAWWTIYEKQRQARKWPDLGEQVTGETFGNWVDSHPADTPLPTSEDGEDAVELYKETLAQQVAELPELVAAAPIPEFNPKRRRPEEDDVNPMMSDPGGVRWSAANYHAIKQRLTPPAEPTAGWALQAQEDIWVYQMLLEAIDKCNGVRGERDKYNLPINRIEFIDLGEQVTRKLDIGRKVDGGEQAELRSLTGEEGGEFEGGLNQPEQEEPEQEEIKKEYGRYFEGEKSPPGFKSLPVRLAARMRLDKVQELMLEMANHDLTTEVVDIYIEDNRGIDGEGGAQRPAPNREAGWGGEFGESPSRTPAAADAGVVTTEHPYVEIWALVHFAEVPNDKALMSEKELEELKKKEEEAAKEKAKQEKDNKQSKKDDDE